MSDASRFDAAAVLREIAKPRLTGSEGAIETGAAIRARFEALGFHVQERPFTFNPWLGRLGLSAVGALYLVASFTAAVFLYTNNPFGAIALLLILLVVAALIALFAGPAIDQLPFARQHGANFYITRGERRPRFIIMAHRDSKSQPVPLAFRGPAIVVASLAWLGLFSAAILHTARPLPASLILLLGILAFIAGVILIFCYVENRSPGALDNASGVAAAIGIAARESDAGDIAFLITDAEELGLAGARAAARSLPPVHGVINMDGLDDDGHFFVLERFGLFRKKGLAPHLAAALLQEAEAMGEPADRRDMPFGIQVDHIPIVRAGTPALTIMRGSLRSLRRVHRPGDDLDHLTGAGVTRTVDLVCGALRRLREQARPLER
ncbi:MAG TPA: M28 family peptidase [Longimicrobiales bacterium]|nr:M28 family peptidase [Longimicrobiales bacterium]